MMLNKQQMEDIPESSTNLSEKSEENNNVMPEQPKISKSQQKKKERLERLLATRKEKRKQEKLRKRAKRLVAMKEAGNILQIKKPTIHSMNESKCRLRVAVDMAFDEVFLKVISLSINETVDGRKNSEKSYFSTGLLLLRQSSCNKSTTIFYCQCTR